MKLAILASGNGSTAEVIFDLASLVVVSDPNAGVLQRLEKYEQSSSANNQTSEKKLSHVLINRQNFKTREEFGEALLHILEEHQIDFISQNGWTVYTPENVVEKYRGKIVNAHPGALDSGYPDFGGPKMNDLVVHQAIINFVNKVQRLCNTEIDLHLVTEEFDKGELVAIKEVEVNKTDTAEQLQQRVKEAEKELLVEFWYKVEKTGKIETIQRKTRVIKPGEEQFLEEAKEEAIEEYA